MKISFIYTFKGKDPCFEPIYKLGELVRVNYNPETLIGEITISTTEIQKCLELFEMNKRIKRIKIWK